MGEDPTGWAGALAGRWHLCRKTKVPLLAAGAAARVDGVLFSAGRRGATPGPGAFVPCTGHTVSLWDFHPADAWHEPARLHVRRALESGRLWLELLPLPCPTGLHKGGGLWGPPPGTRFLSQHPLSSGDGRWASGPPGNPGL